MAAAQKPVPLRPKKKGSRTGCKRDGEVGDMAFGGWTFVLSLYLFSGPSGALTPKNIHSAVTMCPPIQVMNKLNEFDS